MDTLDNWAQAVMYVMIQYSNLQILEYDDWKSWGMNFVNDPYLSTLNPPDPYFFDDWRSWGEKLIIALRSAPEAPPNVAGTSPPSITNPGRFLTAQNGNTLITQSGNAIVTQS